MLCEHARKATTVVPKRYRHLSKVPKRCPARTVGHTKVIKGARHVPGPIRELTSLILHDHGPCTEITRVDTDGRRFSAQATLRRAKRRCVERMHAFEQQVANYTLRKEAKGEDPTDGYEGYQKQVQGILTVGEEGEIVIEPKMREWLESIECTAEGDA